MDRADLDELLAIATETRDHAHRAYTTALINRQADGDTDPAWRALLAANRVRDRINHAIIKSIQES